MIIFEGAPLTWCDSQEHRFLPRWLYVESHPMLERMRTTTRYADLAECFRARGARTLCLHRTHAMGDILMLIPIARAIHRLLGLSSPILLPASLPHAVQLRSFSDSSVKIGVSSGVVDYGCDIHVELDHVLEKDHYDPEYARRDRLQLYANALGFELGWHP